MADSTPGAGRRDALLIATGRYDDPSLNALRSPGQDCARLAGVLADRRIGDFHTEQLKDARAHQVMRAMEEFFRDRSRDDLLLLHISCHGIKDDEDGSLYFVARDTDSELLASTAISASFLRERMDRCRARTIVVLLDCCYSGAFLPGAKGDDRVHVQDELGGHGRAVLTATSRTEYAWEGKHLESSGPAPSRFTGALIEGLSTGAADLNGDGRITVTELYDYVYESLRRAGVKQRPRMWAELEYQVTIARVASPLPQDAPPPPSTPPVARTVPPEQPPLRRSRGQDALLRLELDLVETAQGTVKDIEVDTAVLCPSCTGTGAAQGTKPKKCPVCHGSGQTTEMGGGLRDGLKRAFRGEAETCHYCDGHGTVLSHPCPECTGSGRVRRLRTLTVKIPAGVENGTRIQLAGEGEVGPGGGPAGDLYIEIEERPHTRFDRVRDDLNGRLDISRVQARNGGTFPFDTLLDGQKTIRIPPGIHDGQTLRLPKLGVHHLRGDGRGDLLVRVNVRD